MVSFSMASGAGAGFLAAAAALGDGALVVAASVLVFSEVGGGSPGRRELATVIS